MTKTTFKRFKNGNFNLKLNQDEITEARENPDRTMEIILYNLMDNGLQLIGSEFFLNDFEMGCYLYDEFFDKGYIFKFNDIQKAIDGKAIKFYSRNISEDDRIEIEEELNQ